MSNSIINSVLRRYSTSARSFFSPGRNNLIATNLINSNTGGQAGSIAYKRGFHIHANRKYNINEILINKNLTSKTVKNIRTLNHQRRFNSTESNTNKKGNAKKQQKESIFAKFKRASTFAISTVAVVGASGLALIVIYLLVAEIAFPSGDTQTFNRAVKLVEKDSVSQNLLGFASGERLKAYGEVPGDKWTRNRPISSVRRPGLDGKEHVLMRFTVESKSKTGTVQLEAVDDSFWKQEFSYVILDVPGENRHYIIKPKTPENRFKIRDKNTGFLGVKWGPKKD